MPWTRWAIAAALCLAGCAKKLPPPPEALDLRDRCVDAVKRRHLAAALADCQRATELGPELAPAWAGLGIAHLLGGDAAAAKPALERAVKLDDRVARVHNGLGIVAFTEHRYGDAEGHFRRAVELDPKAPEARFNRAWNFWRWNRPGEAMATLVALAKERPDLGYVFHFIGLLFLTADELEKGSDALVRALEADARDCRAWHGLGVAHYREARFEEASEALRTATELCPEAEGPKTALERARDREPLSVPEPHDLKP